MAPHLVLYKHIASPPSCAVMMLADILDLQYSVEEPSLLKLEHKTPEFRKMNPMGTIPVLRDGNLYIGESHAIIKYVVERYGGEKRDLLYPSDANQRAVIDERMYFDAGVFFCRLKAVARPTMMLGAGPPTEALLADIEDAYSTVELYLQHTTYIAADHITIADLSVGSTAVAIQGIHPLDTDKFPKTSAWLAKLLEEDYFKKFSVPGAALFKQLLQGFWAKSIQAQN